MGSLFIIFLALKGTRSSRGIQLSNMNLRNGSTPASSKRLPSLPTQREPYLAHRQLIAPPPANPPSTSAPAFSADDKLHPFLPPPLLRSLPSPFLALPTAPPRHPSDHERREPDAHAERDGELAVRAGRRRRVWLCGLWLLSREAEVSYVYFPVVLGRGWGGISKSTPSLPRPRFHPRSPRPKH